MASNVIVLESQPGIQRDGTTYDSKNYTSGQWMRFYRGRPLKIGGYRLIDQGNPIIVRTIFNYDNEAHPNSVDTYIGRYNSISYNNFTLNGVALGEIDRTPVDFLTYSDINNQWDLDIFIPVLEDVPAPPIVVAMVAPNADDISNTIEGPIYWGQTIGPNANDPLTQIFYDNAMPVLVSGGIVSASPILIAYGNGGGIRWSKPGEIEAWPDKNFQSISTTKIIKMVLARGSVTPVLLAWTLDSILSLTYTTETVESLPVTTFTPVLIDNNITVMSPNSIVGYANEFYWIGLKKFYFFNGLVRSLENNMNSQFFFERINLTYRSKIFGEIINSDTGAAEIWWFVPLDGAIENNHAIIYNIDKKIWYDTPINRSAGYSSGIFPYPMLADNAPLDVPTRTGIIQVYPIWMHEYGVDQVFDPPSIAKPTNISAIQAFIGTHIYDFFESNPANNRAMRSRRIEPDIKMNGNMNLYVHGRFFPSDSIENGRVKISGPFTFNLNTQKIDVSLQGRLANYIFESNEIGGTFEMGKTLLHYNVGDARPSGSGLSGVSG